MLEKSRLYAIHQHKLVNHTYDDKPYSYHLKMVVNIAKEYINLIPDEWQIEVLSACWLHDIIEDARETYNDVKNQTNEVVADLVYAVTNEKGKTRKERANHKYYKGIRETEFASFIKLADRIANVKYSKEKGNKRMFLKYKKENNNFITAVCDATDNRYDKMIKYLKRLFILDGLNNL